MKAAAHARILALVDPALDALAQLLDSEQGTVQLAAAKDILDRAGFKPGENVNVDLGVGPKRYTLDGLDAFIAASRSPRSPTGDANE